MTTPQVQISFERATVELEALQRAVYALAAVMTVDVAVDGARYLCTVHPRSPATEANELLHRLRAEVNDQSLRVRIARQTAPLRNLIFAVAFSRTGLADDSELDDLG